MTWVALDDQFFSHPKTLRAGRDARDVFLVAVGYCGQHLTDGLIPAGALPMIGSLAIGGDATECAVKLVAVGLWEETDGGWQVHDYLEYQQSKSQVDHRKEKAAERQTNFRVRRAISKSPMRNAVSNGVSNALYNAPVTPPVAGLPSHIHTDTKGKITSKLDAEGAKPLDADVALSSLCAAIAKASRAILDADALKHLVEQHPALDAKSLVFETEMAAEWIADPAKNKRKRKMGVAFLRNWYSIAEKPREETAHGTNSNGTYSAGANGRGQGTRSAQASAPAHAAQGGGERERDPRFPDPFKRTQERLAAFRAADQADAKT